MNSRQRVMTALSHKEPAGFPSIGATCDLSIVVAGYEQLKAHFGIQGSNTLTSG